MSEVFRGDQASALPDRRCQFTRHRPAIKLAWVARDPLQRPSQFRLLKDLALLVVIPSALKDSPRLRELRQSLVMQIARVLPGQRETISCQLNRGSHDLSESELAVLFLRINHARDRPRHSNRLVAHDAGIFDYIALSVEIHIRGCRRWRFFTIVDEPHAPVSRADEHESTPAQISSLRIHHGQGKSGGDSGINRVPAGLHDLHSGSRTQFMNAHHDGVRRMYGLGCRHRRSGHRQP